MDQPICFPRRVLDTQLKIMAMAALDKMSRMELEDLAAKLRHAIARNPANSRMEEIELENVKQWIAIRQSCESEPQF
jgi:hypothetical protein